MSASITVERSVLRIGSYPTTLIAKYIHYDLVVDSNTKEGKKPYKRMEKI